MSSPNNSPITRGKKNKAAAAEIATNEKQLKKMKTENTPKLSPVGTTSVKKNRNTKAYDAHYSTFRYSKDDPNMTEPVFVFNLGSFPNKVGADAAVAGFLSYLSPGGDSSHLALLKSFEKVVPEKEVIAPKTEKVTAQKKSKKSKKESPKEIVKSKKEKKEIPKKAKTVKKAKKELPKVEEPVAKSNDDDESKSSESSESSESSDSDSDSDSSDSSDSDSDTEDN